LHHFKNSKVAEAFARIECHYFINNGFFDSDNWILENVNKIKHIPGIIIQGRYDVVCPMQSAWDLHYKLQKLEFKIVDNAGHSMLEKGIQEELIGYTDQFKEY
jgi:proline iminopeptidase